MLFGERLQEYARWGGPTVVEEFADDGWSARWTPGAGSFHRDGDALVSGGDGFNIIWLDRICPGATAIEYDAALAPGSWPCDVGAVWCSDAHPAASGRALVSPTCYMFKFGAYSGGFTMLMRAHVSEGGQVSDETPLSYSPQTLQSGRSYHVRAQIADNRLDLWVDGKLLCSWRDPFTFASGRIGLLAYDAGKVFSHVRVHIRGVARKVAAISVGDALVQEGDLTGAQREYARVAASFPGSALEREAVFRQGVCAYRLGELAEARALWRPLYGTDHDALVRLQDIDALVAAHQAAEALAAMRALAPDLDQDQLLQLAIEWNALASGLIARDDGAAYAPCLALHDQIFSGEPAIDFAVCSLLMKMGRYDQVLARYPQQRYACATALVHRHRYEEVVAQYPDQLVPYAMAAYQTGQFTLMPVRAMNGLACTARLLQGDADALIAFPDAPVEIRCCALLARGRIDEDLALSENRPYFHALAALAAGKLDIVRASSPALFELMAGDPAKALELADKDSGWYPEAKDALALRRADPGDPTAAVRALADGDVQRADYERDFAHALLAPLLLERCDRTPRLDAIIARIKDQDRYVEAQTLWYDASYLAGEIDAVAFRAQPDREFAAARLTLLDAMRADRGGDRAGALAAYRAWAAMPFWKRSGTPHPGLDGLVAWRIGRLERAAP